MTRHASSDRWVPPLAPPIESLLVAAVVLAIHLLAGISGAFLVGAVNDDGVYAVLGRAIAEGEGYRSLHLVGSPVQVKYPPGFPFVVSLYWRAGGSLEAVQRIAGLLHPGLVACAAGLLWWLGRTRLGVPRLGLAFLVVLPLVLEPAIEYYSIILSEPWLIIGWVGTLAAWLAAEERPPDRARLGLLVATGLLSAATVLLRTQGLFLLAALVVGLFARRYHMVERAAALLAALLPLAAWEWYHRALIAAGPLASFPDETPYTQWLAPGRGGGPWPLLAGLVRNTGAYATQLAPYYAPAGAVGAILVILLLVAAVVASVLALRRRPFLSTAALGSLAIVLLWPYAQARLLLPVLPLLGLSLGAAVAPLVAGWQARDRRLAGAACVVALGCVAVRQVAIRGDAITAFQELRSSRYHSPASILLVASRFVFHAAEWIDAHTAPADRIMTDNGSGIFLYTGRRTVPANPAESEIRTSVFAEPGRFLATRILRDSINWVFVGVPAPGILRDIDTIKQRCPGVLTWGGTAPGDPALVFRVVPDAACLGRLAGG